MFNEDNTIEQFLTKEAREAGWEYIQASDIPRAMNDVMVEPWVKDSLILLNQRLTRDQK